MPPALIATVGDIRAAFNAVLPHLEQETEDDCVFPPFDSVTIEVDGDQDEVFLVGTDRYTMAIVRRELTTPATTGRYRLVAPGWQVIATLKDLGDDTDPVLVLLEREQVTLMLADGTEHAFGDPGASAPDIDWRNKLGKVLAKAKERERTGRVLINPAYLARLESAQRLAPNTPLVIRVAHERAALLATLGNSFFAVIMSCDPAAVAVANTLKEDSLAAWEATIGTFPSALTAEEAGADADNTVGVV